MKRRAKIVCTLGPATASAEAVAALVEAGMDVARLNFSHGTRDSHAAIYRLVREASDRAGRAVAVLADLQGPKIRLGLIAGGGTELETGALFVITTRPVEGTSERAGTNYQALPDEVKAGDPILIDDGRVRLEVVSTARGEVRCRVVEGGRIASNKGLNLPATAVRAPSLTDKDREDLAFALTLRIDLVALSFVRGPGDVEPVRAVLREAGAPLPVIAKIEKPEAVAALDAVLAAFDGIMVARGDLGVEIPLEEVPLVQKRAIRRAREVGKPAIVATQMLESMERQPRPTRAEASDVANAVFDGADALMLSGETSVGAHPLEAVRTMARIIAAVEPHAIPTLAPLSHGPTERDAIAAAAAHVAHDVGAVALVAFTQSGGTAARLAAERSEIPLLAFTPDPAVRSRLALPWGIETFVVEQVADTDAMIAQVDHAMRSLERGKPGDRVVIVAGTPPGTIGSTNTLRVHELGR